MPQVGGGITYCQPKQRCIACRVVLPEPSGSCPFLRGATGLFGLPLLQHCAAQGHKVELAFKTAVAAFQLVALLATIPCLYKKYVTDRSVAAQLHAQAVAALQA